MIFEDCRDTDFEWEAKKFAIGFMHDDDQVKLEVDNHQIRLKMYDESLLFNLYYAVQNSFSDERIKKEMDDRNE